MNLVGKVKEIATPFFMGLGQQFAPDIIKGFLIKYLSDIPVKTICTYVEKKESLLSMVPPGNLDEIKAMAARVKDWSFLTSDWLIEAVREDIPATASLFLNWKKGRNWLDKQVEIIKQELES